MNRQDAWAFWSRRYRRKPSRAEMSIVAAVLVPIALWLWIAIDTRADALAASRAYESRVTEALSQYTLNLLKSASVMLDLIDQQAGDSDCAALRADSKLNGFLAKTARRTDELAAAAILDADGFICAVSDPALSDAASRRDRDFFIGARNAGAGRDYLGRSVVGVTDGRPYFNLARPRFKNGAFNGVSVVSVNLNALTRDWTDILGATPTQRLAVYRSDGVTVARSWLPLVPQPDPAAEQRLAAVWRDAPAGARDHLSPTDGTRRVGAWRSLPGRGVVVGASIAQAEALRVWRRSIVIDGALAALASVLLGLLAMSLFRGQQKLAQTVAERTRALRTSQEQLSLFIERAPAAIAMFDTEMRYLAASRRYLADYGLDLPGPEALLGRCMYDVLPHPAELWRHRHRRVLSGETLSGEDDQVTRLDGQTDWHRWEMTPWHRSDGEVGGVVLFSEVITKRKQAELVLSRSKDELERLVDERTRALEATQRRLAHAQRMEALGQLAGGIAHDFNNVLQGMQAGAALIERRPADAERVRSLARMLHETADRGATITRRLLAFARQGDLRAEPVDAAGLLAAMQEILAHTLGTGIAVTVAIADGLPPLLADKGQLETVLVNLATNARDAMQGTGTLTLAAAAEARHADAASHPTPLKPGRYVRLSVADTGAGMAPEVLARASEPFFTTKGVGQGTGLGLAMARGFAEQSGGGLQIESTLGHGTVVTLWFPVPETPAAPADRGPERAATAAGETRARLLLVDDDTVVRETLAQLIEQEGYAVLTAAGGAEALALLDAGEAVDLIVADLSMPGMDGMTLIREARRRRAPLPVILLTGFATNEMEIAMSGAMSGTFSLLRKPVRGSVLGERIAVLLETAAQSPRSR